MEELGIKGKEAVFVGDSIEEDIKGAKGVGMRTVLIEQEEPFRDFSRKERNKDIVPDAKIGNLRELLNILERFKEG